MVIEYAHMLLILRICLVPLILILITQNHVQYVVGSCRIYIPDSDINAASDVKICCFKGLVCLTGQLAHS